MKKQGYATVLLKPEGNHPEIEDVTRDAEFICNSIEEAYEQISKSGFTRDVVLASDRSHVITNEIYHLQDRLHEAGIPSLTTLLVDLKGEAVDEELPYGPLETLWQFDADAEGNITRHPLSPTWPLEVYNNLTFSEHEGKTTLTLRGGPINATEEERKTFDGAHKGLQRGFAGTFDQLAEYLAKA